MCTAHPTSLITPFPSDPNADTRASVALALSRFPDLSNENLPLLVNTLEIEQDSEVRYAIQEAIDRLDAGESA